MAIWYGRLATSFRRRRVERLEWEREGVPEDELDVFAAGQRIAQVRLEAAVELDGVDEAHTFGEIRGEDAEAGADLEHDVFGSELREAARDAEDVVVDQEVLAEIAVGRDGQLHGRPKAAVAFASIARSSSSRSSPRASARVARVWTTCAGSFRRPRTG